MSDSNNTQSLGIVTRSGLVLKPAKSSTSTSLSQKHVPEQLPQGLGLSHGTYVETKEEKEWRLYQEEEEWWAQYEWRCKKELSAMGI